MTTKNSKPYKRGDTVDVKVTWTDSEYKGFETIIPKITAKKYVIPSPKSKQNAIPSSPKRQEHLSAPKSKQNAIPSSPKRQEHLSAYEKKRLQRISENEKKLMELGLTGAKISNYRDIPSPSTNRRSVNTQPRKRKAFTAPVNKRRSSRLKGVQPVKYAESDIVTSNSATTILEMDEILTPEEYYKIVGITPRVVTDGHFYSWVNPKYVELYGLASNAKDAWNSNGGGKFTYATPDGFSGGSKAKETARRMFRKNPNSYFYRHTAPGVARKFDSSEPWTKEEEELFIQIAKKHGAGDKWGLFSSYIPGRIGYQCSQYYRKHMIKHGIIQDPNFAFTNSGKPIYVGNKGGHGGR
jgi:hypothetical protein